ncbi:MAG: KEOPS complex kinase/ATPase Bud32 [archaeon]
MKQIASGAEAVIYLDGNIVKERIPKKYRIPEIDVPLRKSRTRREAKILDRLSKAGFPAPRPLGSDEKKMTISMDFIDGDKIRDILEKSSCRTLCSEIGKKVALLHNMGIIHGDLTTSNMILKGEVYFIDFGLGFFSEKIEDKAVDLHLLRQALESKHYTIWEEAFDSVLAGYKSTAENCPEILRRFQTVEARGRNKGKH